MTIASLRARLRRWAALGGALAALLAGTQAHALPSFARQTGMECAACHIGAFGPQLTPAGIRFKLGGYTDSDGKDGHVPISAMVVSSFSRTQADQAAPPAGFKPNNNVALDEASLFLAGKLADHVGTFIQLTHDGVEHANALDHVDIRYARTVELAGKDTVLGLTVNNNPGVQDPFNTLPAWGAPFASSPFGEGTGGVASLLNGGLEHRVLGASGYVFFNDRLYGELGTYRSLSPSTQDHLGAGTDLQKLGGNTYWRLGWLGDQKSQAYHLGVFGWNASLLPDRTVGGPYNRYRDIGIDGGYQLLGTREHVLTLDGSLLKERMTDGTTLARKHTTESRLSLAYNFRQTWGASAGLFSTRGNDPLLPTRGQVFQVDWTPWGKEGASAPAPLGWTNLRLGAQYWRYDKFEGSTVGARDHNTLYLFAWLSF